MSAEVGVPTQAWPIIAGLCSAAAARAAQETSLLWPWVGVKCGSLSFRALWAKPGAESRGSEVPKPWFLAPAGLWAPANMPRT